MRTQLCGLLTPPVPKVHWPTCKKLVHGRPVDAAGSYVHVSGHVPRQPKRTDIKAEADVGKQLLGEKDVKAEKYKADVEAENDRSDRCDC